MQYDCDAKLSYIHEPPFRQIFAEQLTSWGGCGGSGSTIIENEYPSWIICKRIIKTLVNIILSFFFLQTYEHTINKQLKIQLHLQNLLNSGLKNLLSPCVAYFFHFFIDQTALELNKITQ
jgi:hypothetical protein